MKQAKIIRGLFVIMAPLIVDLSLQANQALAAPGKPMSDEWVEGRAQGALAYNRYLDSSDVSIEVKKGQATLSGTVPSETERELAKNIASNIEGVVSVDNRIKVDPEVGYRTRPDWIQNISDATTTAAVKNRLLASKSMHDMTINISTKNGVVALTGTVASMAQRENAERIAFNTRDVRDVQNDLKIADPSTLSEKANNASVNAATDVSDSWVTSKIRASLLFSSDFPGSDVSVTTNKGNVTVDGYARNSAQREEIGKMINEFVGVKNVENNLKLKQQS